MTARTYFTPESIAENERKWAEAGVGMGGDEPARCRLPGARRPPEDHGVGAAGLDRGPQRFAGAEDVLLADELVEGARAHAIGEGACRVGGGVEEPGLGAHGHGGTVPGIHAPSVAFTCEHSPQLRTHPQASSPAAS